MTTHIIRPTLVMFVLISALTGLLYPLAVTGVARSAFPSQAAGSLVVRDGVTVGSTLIGQNFSDPAHFWGRLSATTPMPYNGASSGGSNLGPSNPALVEAVKARIAALREADPGNTAAVAAARYQAPRVARLRQVPVEQVLQLIDAHTESDWWGLMGEPRVNVLALNLALDTQPAP